MTQPAPRRLLLVASDATPRGTTAPIRRYRLGRVLMGPQELIGVPEHAAQRALDAAGSGPQAVTTRPEARPRA